MDDKPPELAALIEKIHKIEETLATVTNDLAQACKDSHEREQARLKAEMARLSAVPASALLAGRYTRRDGDGFATVPRKFGSADPENADRKTGDI